MKPIDAYIDGWSGATRTKSTSASAPILITGIHGDDPVKVYKELGEVVQEVIDHFQQTGRELPPHGPGR